VGWTHLFYRQGWDVYWNAADGRMYAKENSTFGKTPFQGPHPRQDISHLDRPGLAAPPQLKGSGGPPPL